MWRAVVGGTDLPDPLDEAIERHDGVRFGGEQGEYEALLRAPSEVVGPS